MEISDLPLILFINASTHQAANRVGFTKANGAYNIALFQHTCSILWR